MDHSSSLPASASAGAASTSASPAAVRERHATATIVLHWASVLALVIATVAVLGRELTEHELLRVRLLELHRQSGLFVLLALGLRLAVRWRFGLRDHAGPQPRLLQVAAQLAHLGLYALLLALPLLGLAASQAHAVPVTLFGLWPLPALLPADPDLADNLSDWHTACAWTLLGLVGAHVTAAIWHHRVRRDGVLHAMLPWVRRRR